MAAWAKRLDKQDMALNETNRALAVLLSEHGALMKDVKTNKDRLGTLEVATAVLMSRIDEYKNRSGPER